MTISGDKTVVNDRGACLTWNGNRLPGHGRADAPVGTTIGIFLQVIDPNAFAGLDAFTRQTGWLVGACHANVPQPGKPRVRLPGEQALVRQREAMEQGLPLADGVVKALQPLAEAAGLTWPTAQASAR